MQATLGFIKNTSDQDELSSLNEELQKSNKVLQEAESNYEKFARSIEANEQKISDLRQKRAERERIEAAEGITTKSERQKIAEEKEAAEIQSLEAQIETEKKLKEKANKEVLENEIKIKKAAAEVESKEAQNRNRENARGFVSGIAALIADIYVPGLGQIVGPFVGAMTQGADAIREQLGGMLSEIPGIIEALPETIPAMIDALVEGAPEIIASFIEHTPEIATSLIRALSDPDLYINFAKALFSSLSKISWGGIFKNTIFDDPFKDVKFKNPFEDLNISPLSETIDTLGRHLSTFAETLRKFSADSLGGIFKGGGGGGGSVGKAVKSIGRRLGFATGGIVTGPGNRDSVPATLSPGELVVDRTTGPRLMDYIDRNEKMESQPSMDMGNVELLLSQLLQASQAEKTVQSTIELDQEALATILLRMNQDNQRLE